MIQRIVSRTTFHFTTRIHLLVNAYGPPVRPEITPGQTPNRLGFDPVIPDNPPGPEVLRADRGYDTTSIRARMQERDILPVISMRKSRAGRAGLDCSLHRLRNPAERCFDKLKNARRIVTRHDKTVESLIDVTSIRLWISRLST